MGSFTTGPPFTLRRGPVVGDVLGRGADQNPKVGIPFPGLLGSCCLLPNYRLSEEPVCQGRQDAPGSGDGFTGGGGPRRHGPHSRPSSSHGPKDSCHGVYSRPKKGSPDGRDALPAWEAQEKRRGSLGGVWGPLLPTHTGAQALPPRPAQGHRASRAGVVGRNPPNNQPQENVRPEAAVHVGIPWCPSRHRTLGLFLPHLGGGGWGWGRIGKVKRCPSRRHRRTRMLFVFLVLVLHCNVPLRERASATSREGPRFTKLRASGTTSESDQGCLGPSWLEDATFAAGLRAGCQPGAGW